ncbi:hypothetical protein [Paenibacillus sp. BAC0078]
MEFPDFTSPRSNNGIFAVISGRTTQSCPNNGIFAVISGRSTYSCSNNGIFAVISGRSTYSRFSLFHLFLVHFVSDYPDNILQWQAAKKKQKAPHY